MDSIEVMNRPARVVAVRHVADHRLEVTFSDGLRRELDFAGTLTRGVFRALLDLAVFAVQDGDW